VIARSSISDKDLRLKEYLPKETQLKGQDFLDLTHQRIVDQKTGRGGLCPIGAWKNRVTVKVIFLD
jgi:hypothetical protein